eukprot:GFUD01023777.1.p1 GENE.GFUD01023777.1~~GFUD01023777.1.p1  ORF type:complete len:422 (-),score=148.64 GFUD01023777.1:164-1429(-)
MVDKEIVNTKVFVSCIESINKFYILKANEAKTVVQIQKQLNRVWYTASVLELENGMGEEEDNSEGGKEVEADDINPGELVIAKFQDNLFYRAKVLSIFIELDTSLTEVDMAEVLYIDYGNIGMVPINSTRPISSSLLALPPLAIQCSLFDCLALGEDTTTEFRGLVNKGCLLLETMGRREEVLEVDLIREMGDNMGYSSVRDVLVLCGKAVFYSSPSTIIPNVEERDYKQLPSLVAGSVHTVMLSHLHQLSHQQLPQLSVQLFSDQDKVALQLPSLMDQMGEVYGVKRSEELWGLGRCWPGMVCAVRDSRDKMWYRGQVVKIGKGRMVRVKYVDFGNTELVPDHKLRRLFKDFMVLPAMATRVSMEVKVEGAEVMAMLKEGIDLVDLNMKIVKEGSEELLPMVELKVEGNSVNNRLKQFVC